MNIDYRRIKIQERNNVIKLWNNNIGSLFPIDNRLFNGNLDMDKNFEEGNLIGAFLEDKLIGCVLFKQHISNNGLVKYDNKKGNISFLMVDFKYRRKGLGSKLLNICENELLSKGVKEIEIGRDTFHFFPGVPSEFREGIIFLKKNNYVKTFDSYDLINDISKCHFDEIKKLRNLKLNNEYCIEELKEKDIDKLMDFLKKCFKGRWYGDSEIFFNNGMDCRDIIVIKDTEKDIIIGFSHIYDKRSKVIGPGIYWRELLGENYGGLGPIGVDEDYRKKGLGLTLLYKSLYILKSRGVRKMVIDWTNLFDFYGIFNFVIWKKYIHMQKMVE